MATYKADILIVDDTPDNLKLLSQMLAAQRYKVRSVTSGSMALKAAKAAQPDLVLLDILMPELDGYEVCQQLKQQSETSNTANLNPVQYINPLKDGTCEPWVCCTSPGNAIFRSSSSVPSTKPSIK